jgi:uncharacterized protein DUF4384
LSVRVIKVQIGDERKVEMSRLIILAIVLLAAASGVLLASAQQSDDDVRGAFLSTRPKSTNTNAPKRTRPKPPKPQANTSSTTAKNANLGKNANIANNTSFTNTNSNRLPLPAIALGYTIFMRDMNGRAVRVDPTREFHNGDRIRISLEPNVDGYVYVFHTENDGPPELLYPDARLEGGENWIEAHVPIEIPSTLETDERLRWFQFYGNAGTERLYVVVTRDPLPEVPIAENLLNFCTANKDKCPWHPPADAWAQIQQASKAEVRVVTSKTSAGQAQTDKEQVATTRGLGLDQTAPQPSVIRMSAATNAPVLVTILDLVHK